MQRKLTIIGRVPRLKRRAIELFADHRFFLKKEISKKSYDRRSFGKKELDNN